MGLFSKKDEPEKPEKLAYFRIRAVASNDIDLRLLGDLLFLHGYDVDFPKEELMVGQQLVKSGDEPRALVPIKEWTKIPGRLVAGNCYNPSATPGPELVEIIKKELPPTVRLRVTAIYKRGSVTSDDVSRTEVVHQD